MILIFPCEACPVISIRRPSQALIPQPGAANRCSQQASHEVGARSWSLKLENDTQTHDAQADLCCQNQGAVETLHPALMRQINS